MPPLGAQGRIPIGSALRSLSWRSGGNRRTLLDPRHRRRSERRRHGDRLGAPRERRPFGPLAGRQRAEHRPHRGLAGEVVGRGRRPGGEEHVGETGAGGRCVLALDGIGAVGAVEQALEPHQVVRSSNMASSSGRSFTARPRRIGDGLELAPSGRSPRWQRMRTAPSDRARRRQSRRPIIPTITRNASTSRCSGVRRCSISSAAAVWVADRRTAGDVGEVDPVEAGDRGRRWRRRPQSMARRRAIVNTQPRKSCSSPRNEPQVAGDRDPHLGLDVVDVAGRRRRRASGRAAGAANARARRRRHRRRPAPRPARPRRLGVLPTPHLSLINVTRVAFVTPQAITFAGHHP